MKKLLWGFSLMLFGCAHQAPRSVAVEFPYAVELLSRIQASAPVQRGPASLFAWPEKEEKSLRRTYFSVLYHQYLAFGSMLQTDSQLDFCPQFHHDKVEIEKRETQVGTSLAGVPRGLERSEYFPELAFNETFSLKDYHGSLKTELGVLCEEGVSDNYFKFDNLVTHHASKASFHRETKSMAAVLKIPVFANLYLLKMLEARPAGLIEFHPEEKRVIELTHTQWFEKYLAAATEVRSDLLRTKMVRR
jgi:hypothetical protein